MLHGRNNESVLHQNEHLLTEEKNTIVPAMQHGRRATSVGMRGGTIYHGRFLKGLPFLLKNVV